MKKNKLYILNLEDNANDTELIQAALEEEGVACEVTRVETEEEFVSALNKTCFDLLLIDYNLPSFNGMSALAIAKKKCPDIPFIFVSGSIGEDRAIETLKNGATDYVLKTKLSRLAPAVRRAIKEAEEKNEHRKAEEALRKSEKKYRDLIDTMSEGLGVQNRDGLITFMNKRACEMLGYEPAELIGKPAAFLFDEENREVLRRQMAIRQRGERQSYEIVWTCKDGGKIATIISPTPIFDEKGNLEESIAVFTDITERKHLETQLRHAQKMEAVGTLAGGIAHDFNNILNVIIGFGSMAMDRIGDDQISKEHMNEVLAAAERASNLTKRLLLFSRKEVSEVKPLDVNEIVINMEKMLARIIGEDINLVADLMGKKVMVMADSGQIEQVLMNLASNARDAMPKGGSLTIKTELREIDDEFIKAYEYGVPGTYAVISMTDTGTGIDKEKQVRIFDPFFTTKEVGKGTGLGLSIAYGIIKQHNGYIKVYSEPGKGTAFRIWLPVIADTAVKKLEVEVLPSLRGGTETILVAEDDDSMRKLTRTVLEAFGYTVITAEDGEDAITKYTENRGKIKLVILDMIMPKKSGKEACGEIKRLSPDSRILFLSGYTMDIIKTQTITDEGFDFILKPVSPKDLVRKVREILDK